MLQKIEVISKRSFFKIISYRYSTSIVKEITVLSRKPAVPLNELKIIYRTVRSIKPKTILEIGTSYGYLTLGLFINAIYANVYTIDICKEMKVEVPPRQKSEVRPKSKVGWAFRNKIPGIYQILGDSRYMNTYSVLKGKTVDFAFIDGNHSFEAVVKDTRNILKFVNKNSIIFWHDFNDVTGVKIALDNLACINKLKIFHIDKTTLAFSFL